MVLTESEILNKLYSGECKASVKLDFNDKSFIFKIELKNKSNEIDCCIINYDFGIFVRTPKGSRHEKYKSIDDLKREVRKALTINDALRPVAIIITADDFSQRLSLE